MQLYSKPGAQALFLLAVTAMHSNAQSAGDARYYFDSVPVAGASHVPPPPGPEWVRNAVFYEIYPQSFMDSDGDGIGDLRGIIGKLDYVKSLGVDAVWLNPFYESPFRDAGYDVSDYCKVAPRYGTNDDARELFARAHEFGLRVIIDFVPGHTSVDHPWFKQSCEPQMNERSNWYVWTKGTWFAGMDKYREGFIQGYCDRDGNYLSNFFWHQPALNYGYGKPDAAQSWQLPVDHPDILALREEMKRIMRYWLDMGADGFRIDMAGSLVKNDPEHRILDFWQDVRDMLDRDYPEAFIISEWSDPAVALDSAFHADFMHWFPGYDSLWANETSFFNRSGRGDICRFLHAYLPARAASASSGYISLPVGNHDLARVNRAGRDRVDLEMIYVFQFTMPNVPFIYYGDEIGMRDLPGLTSREGSYGRSSCRTPMQWDAALPNMGFSFGGAGNLYFPVDSSSDAPCVAVQEGDSASMLNFVRRLVALKKAHPALANHAGFVPVYAMPGRYPFVFQREGGGERILVVINPANERFEVVIKGELPNHNRLLFGKGVVMKRLPGETGLAVPPRTYAVYLLDIPQETGLSAE